SGQQGSDSFTISGYASGINAGTYTDNLKLTELSGNGLSNYEVSYTPGHLIINPAVINAQALNISGSKVYDGNATFTATHLSLSGILPADSGQVSLDGSATVASHNVGTYTNWATNSLSLTGSASTNYTLTGGAVSVSINPANLTITGNTRAVTYNGGSQTNTFGTSGLVGSDSVMSVTGLASGTNYSATPYADSLSAASGSGLDNYTINYVNGSLTISKASLTVTGANRIVTYNGATQTNAVATVTGQQGSDSFTTSGYASGTNAATYFDNLSVSGSALSNYAVTYNNGSLVIGKANLTITGNTRTVTYNAGSQTNTYTTSGLLGSDSVTSVAGLATGTNYSATAYADNLSAVSGSGLDNYTVSYVNGSLTINKASLTVTGANTTVTYNGAPQTNAVATVSGKQGNDSFTVSGYASGTNAATYTDNLSVSGSALSNYAVTYNNGSLVIGKANLTITGSTRTVTYNAGAQTNTYSTSGLVGSDLVLSVTGLASGTNYSATPYADNLSAASGSGLDNYTINYVNGSLTINKASLTVTGANTTVTYNG
ncbi:MAG: hypothetical protein EBR59_10170, partial [Methylococcaceae bacterium]|nr:hypothetical protein [Methylococcaceae bacterium]